MVNFTILALDSRSSALKALSIFSGAAILFRDQSARLETAFRTKAFASGHRRSIGQSPRIVNRGKFVATGIAPRVDASTSRLYAAHTDRFYNTAALSPWCHLTLQRLLWSTKLLLWLCTSAILSSSPLSLAVVGRSCHPPASCVRAHIRGSLSACRCRSTPSIEL